MVEVINTMGTWPHGASLSLCCCSSSVSGCLTLPLCSGKLAGVHQCPLTHTHTHCVGVAGSQAWSWKLSSSSHKHIHGKHLHIWGHISERLLKLKMIHFCSCLPTHKHRLTHTWAHRHADGNEQSVFLFLILVTCPGIHDNLPLETNTTYAMCMCALDCARACHFLSPIPLSISTQLVTPLPCKQSQV